MTLPLPTAPQHTALARALDHDVADDALGLPDDVPDAIWQRALLGPAQEFLRRPGKALRARLVELGWELGGGAPGAVPASLPSVVEALHAGSLIVDDVQDRSTVRRGGPTCHVVHGEPVAINAGTAAYFLTQHLLQSDELSAEQKLRIYDLYFAAMRAGHAGQAIDLGGMAELMPGVVATGDSATLEQRILACHRLKTAAPAGCLARMGAVAGGGTTEQTTAVGEFFEAMGLAFQIMDDVLNLRGFKGDLKQRGEDITTGTVTLPVAIAMGKLPEERRAWLWQTLQARTSDPVVVAEAVELIESCGALTACTERARELVEAGWRKAEALLEPSLARVMLRAFGWYVLERHY